jgi:hypothetical protein
MRGDEDLLRAHAQEKARQSVRLAAARRTAQPVPILDSSGRIGISGVRSMLMAFFMALALTLFFAALSTGRLGGMHYLYYYLPLLVPPLMVLGVDRPGYAGWKTHILIGIIGLVMLLGLPLIINLVALQTRPYGFDGESIYRAFDYIPYLSEYMLGYIPAGAISAPATGWLLRILSQRKSPNQHAI